MVRLGDAPESIVTSCFESIVTFCFRRHRNQIKEHIYTSNQFPNRGQRFSRRPRSRKCKLPWPEVRPRRRSGTRERWGKRLTRKFYLTRMVGTDFRPKFLRYNIRFHILRIHCTTWCSGDCNERNLLFFWYSLDEARYSLRLGWTFEDQLLSGPRRLQVSCRGETFCRIFQTLNMTKIALIICSLLSSTLFCFTS